MSNGIFSFDICQQYLDRTVELLRSRDVDAAVFGTGAGLRYPIGPAVTSHERLTTLVVTATDTAVLVLPAVKHGGLLLCAIGDLNTDVMLREDGENPHCIVADLVGHVGALAVGASLTANHLIPIQDLTGAGTALAGDLLGELLTRKDAAEADQLREAGAAIGRVHAHVPGMLRAGYTGHEVADGVSAATLEEGHVAIDFAIADSTENGANLHHDSSNRVIEKGDVVVTDIGDTSPLGYRPDCTRTYVAGKPGEKEAIAWTALHKAQEAAVAAVRLGMTAAEINATARNSLTAVGYGEHFVRRTGHGTGLSMREELFVMTGNELKLGPGMAFSMEPGVYLPGEFGMRLEDIIVIIEDGGESVNNGPHGSITV